MQHLDDGTLQSWLDRDRSGISGEEAAEVEAHIAGCEACRARAAELGGTSQEVQALLASVGPRTETPPDFAEVVRRSRRGRPSGKDGRRWMAAAWAASIALATGLGWMSHDLLWPGAGDRTSTSVAEADGSVAGDAGLAGSEVAAADLPANEPVLDIQTAREAEAEGSEARDAGVVGSEVAAAERAAAEAVRGEGTEVAAAEVEESVAARRALADSDRAAEGAGVEGLVVLGLAREPLAAALRAREAVIEAGGAREARPAAPGAREVWVPVARSHAESEAGFALLTVPGLPVLEVELGGVDGVPAVRVRQELASGATLTLVQWEADGGEVAPALPEGQAVVTVEREGMRVTGAAPVTLDSLRTMMEGIR